MQAELAKFELKAKLLRSVAGYSPDAGPTRKRWDAFTDRLTRPPAPMGRGDGHANLSTYTTMIQTATTSTSTTMTPPCIHHHHHSTPPPHSHGNARPPSLAVRHSSHRLTLFFVQMGEYFLSDHMSNGKQFLDPP